MKMDAKKYTEMQDLFTRYLAEKKLRKTEERYAILECICSFPGHFDMCLLHQKLEEMNFHVSRATVYNTVDVLVDSGLIVRHQLTAQAVQYELRMLAETHLHLICTSYYFAYARRSLPGLTSPLAYRAFNSILLYRGSLFPPI